MKLYSLFKYEGKRWIRVEGAGCYRRSTAVRIFKHCQSESLDHLSIRPVRSKTPTLLLPCQWRLRCG